MTTDVEREAFELEMGFVDKPRREDGEYKSDAVQHRWDGWQAGAAWQRAQSAPVVPEGWRLVPADPTQAMREAGNDALDRIAADATRGLADKAFYVFCAMLAAAPQPARQPLELSISPEWVRKAAEAEQGHVIAAGVPDPAARQEQGDEVCVICDGRGSISFDDQERRARNGGNWGRCLNCRPYPAQQMEGKA